MGTQVGQRKGCDDLLPFNFIAVFVKDATLNTFYVRTKTIKFTKRNRIGMCLIKNMVNRNYLQKRNTFARAQTKEFDISSVVAHKPNDSSWRQKIQTNTISAKKNPGNLVQGDIHL